MELSSIVFNGHAVHAADACLQGDMFVSGLFFIHLLLPVLALQIYLLQLAWYAQLFVDIRGSYFLFLNI